MRLGFRLTPGARASTRNRLVPAMLPAEAPDPVRADTTSVWADGAPTTTHLSPLNTQPLVVASALVACGALS